jgi:cobalamin-dependent methionine synthase I
MAAVVFALAGWRTVILGVDTPVKQIAALAREASLAAVAISLVRSRTTANQSRTIATLRRAVPSQIPILLGGAGVAGSRASKGLLIMKDMYALYDWTQNRAK